MINDMVKRIRIRPWLALAAAVAIVGTLGSLFFSEIWQLVPCKLCWLQRIFMYPLAFILPIGLWFEDRHVYRYALPLGIVGLLIAVYHNFMYYQANYLYGVSDTVLTACSGGVSCTNVQLEWLGFISIPLLSLAGFGLICGLLWWQRRQEI